jgi:mRNA interferase RelE/StbE
MAAVIEVPDDLDVRVEALAARSGRSKASIMLEVLRGVLEDIEDLYESERVMERIRAGEPPSRLGQPLAGDLKGFWRYRVGDFWVICDIQDDRLVVLVVRLGNRRDVYR